jgi:hypothetical protein
MADLKFVLLVGLGVLVGWLFVLAVQAVTAL